MNESEYKAAYQDVNDSPCIFSRALLVRCAQCEHAQKLLLAEREAIACRSAPARLRCARLLDLLHEKARFALQLTHTDAPLPHGKEIKVQCGGLAGLHASQQTDAAGPVDNVQAVVARAIAEHGDLEQLPYGSIVQGITQYRLKKRGAAP